jgi:hypothetical protein
MRESSKGVKTLVRDPKQVVKPCFITYMLSCFDEEAQLIDLEISPFAILIAGDVISSNKNITIEQGFSEAVLNILDSIESQYTILGFKQNEKSSKKTN